MSIDTAMSNKCIGTALTRVMQTSCEKKSTESHTLKVLLYYDFILNSSILHTLGFYCYVLFVLHNSRVLFCRQFIFSLVCWFTPTPKRS